jgi:hypothetical protein
MLAVEATVPASASAWTGLGSNGFKYLDPSGAQAGIQKVILKGSADAKAKIIAKSKGSNLPDPCRSRP